ncbi:blast:Uncharacterized protein CG4951 [Drosophila guanche]|uniref:Blast:Uncharacterized protein CG4951 n=1 Tax=Drosophila guanche TaxID=7266 RepID=A0A3B0J815_DROGU|nr:blast:Uncharacterized protein CG4951 [Drosophila guanche]
MAFTTIREFQFVVQRYKYNEQRIFCHTKVLPSPVTTVGKKSYNYHWVTPAKWKLIAGTCSIWWGSSLFGNCMHVVTSKSKWIPPNMRIPIQMTICQVLPH